MLDYIIAHQIGLLEIALFLSVFVLVVTLIVGSKNEATEKRFKRRMHSVSGGKPLRDKRGSEGLDAELRRRQIRSAMQEKNNSKGPDLKTRLKQSGLGWSKQKFFLICLGCMGAIFAALTVGTKMGPVGAGIVAVPVGWLAPYFYVLRAIKQRLKKFSQEFPTALDIIVRGVSAGLPLTECLRTITMETKEPVRGEFIKLLNDQSVGMSLEKAVHRLAERVPLAETSFFAIVLAVQARAGGSLSEILNNLSNVVRGRKMLDAQIRTMSSEAKMSGRMIGSMPILVSGALFYLSPDYITILTGTGVGRVVLLGCGLWMLTGVMVMKKMINFDV